MCFPATRRPVGLLSSKGGRGIFNERDDLGACCAPEAETGTDESAQVVTRKDKPKEKKNGAVASRVQESNACPLDWQTSALANQPRNLV